MSIYSGTLSNLDQVCPAYCEVSSFQGVLNKALHCISVLTVLHFRDVIMHHGVCIRVLGDIELLPSDVQQSVAKAVLMTKENTRSIPPSSPVLGIKCVYFLQSLSECVFCVHVSS